MCHSLAFFPTPYPDEDFRSIVYRYHIRVGYDSFNSTCLDLYGRKLNLNLPIPINTIALINKLPFDCGIDMDSLLNHNTYWPVLRIYINNLNLNKSLSSIQYGQNAKTGVNRYLTHSGILSSQIRYCTECLKEDFYRYGECFAHLSHQIKDIFVCPIHHISLLTHCPVCDINLSKEDGTSLLVTPYCLNGHFLLNLYTEKCNTLEAQMQLYHDILVIINNSKKLTQKEILLRYRLACIHKGYTERKGLLRKGLLFNDILAAIATSPNRIASLIDYSQILRALNKPIIKFDQLYFHSLPFFIFLMYFFYGSVEKLLRSNLLLTEELSKAFHGRRTGTIAEFTETHYILENLLSSFHEVAVTD